MPTAPAAFTAEEILGELKSLGSETNVRTFSRHGVTGDFYGVSYANLYALQKKIKRNHELAQQLWKTGNHDARVLATLIADPALAEEALEEWLPDVTNHVLGTMVATFVGNSPSAQAIGERWMADQREHYSTVAFGALGAVAYADNELPDSYFEALLEKVAREIHDRPNRTRYSMLSLIIAIGTRNEDLKARALEVSQRIGKVTVDHGDTSCKTPNPLTEIEKCYAHRHRKKK